MEIQSSAGLCVDMHCENVSLTSNLKWLDIKDRDGSAVDGCACNGTLARASRVMAQYAILLCACVG